MRQGRLLRWREGEGYSFSDLSMKRPGRRFPHVYIYKVMKVDAMNSRVRIAVRGKWTARVWPRAVVRLWLWWVMRHTLSMVVLELLAVWRRMIESEATAAG